jgi:hypothetical protein
VAFKCDHWSIFIANSLQQSFLERTNRTYNLAGNGAAVADTTIVSFFLFCIVIVARAVVLSFVVSKIT